MKLQRYKTYESIVTPDLAEKADLLMALTIKKWPEMEEWPPLHAVVSMYMRRFLEPISMNQMADRFVELYKKKKDNFFFGKDKLKEYEAIQYKHQMGIAFQKDVNTWIGIYDVDSNQRYNNGIKDLKGPGYYKGPDMDEACKVALGFF